jgi:hypothetical protein
MSLQVCRGRLKAEENKDIIPTIENHLDTIELKLRQQLVGKWHLTRIWLSSSLNTEFSAKGVKKIRKQEEQSQQRINELLAA